MNFIRTDFSKLKWELLILMCALCTGGTAIGVSENFTARAQRDLQTAQHQLSTALSQLAAINEDSVNMKAYTFEYGELLKRNIIGDDHRMDWIEGLENIRKQHRVLDFKYSITPQRHYTPPSVQDSGNFKLNMSDMTLQFDLLHEKQLLDFFDILRADINGWFILDHCAIERMSTPDATPQLKATCTGGWLTLKNKNTK